MISKFSKVYESSSDTFKIGLDFHGVIDTIPDFFKFFTKAIIDAGGEVHILTGGMAQKDLDLLKSYDIKYTKMFSILQYHKEIGTPTSGVHPKYGFDMISDTEWDKTKADYCEREGIDLHIDDTLAYNEFFKTPFARFWSHNNRPKINKEGKYLD